MGFRFRKSFKVMPGVRVNMSSKGFSTTIGGRGASVNISKRGTYLNTSIPGTGLSSRTRVGGDSRSVGSASKPAIPRTPQPASTRWFSFGVTFATIGVIASLLSIDKPSISINERIGGMLFWVAVGVAWWLVRRTLRANKQSRYEAYVAQQTAEAKALEDSIAEAKQQKQLADEQAAAAAQRLREEREQQRLAAFEPALSKARMLWQDGLISAERLAKFEDVPRSSYASATALDIEVNALDKQVRAEDERCKNIRAKYSEPTAQQLVARQITPGMTREQLIDSLGDTSKIERTLTKDGERETLIYGSKTTGSYFHIVNGLIVKAVVR